jgi:hypothetical protein
MIKLLTDTFTDANAFWAMVEALATVAAAFFIIIQLRRLREESAAHKAEGIDWLYRFVSDDVIDLNVRSLRDNASLGSLDTALSVLPNVLAAADLVREQVKEGFVTERMVLIVAGSQYYSVNRSIDRLLGNPNSEERARRIISYRPDAYEFVKAMARHSSEIIQHATSWPETNK